MKKISQFILLLSLLCLALSQSLLAQARQKPRKPYSNLNITQVSLYIDSYEFGPAVSGLVVEMNSDIRRLDWSETEITTATISRQVTEAFLSDAYGNPIEDAKNSKYLTLKLNVTYNPDDPAQSASPFTFDLASYRNRWIDSYVVAISNLKVVATNSKQTQVLNVEQETINNLLTPTADRFSERDWVSGLQYAAYQPSEISGGEKNPLIIWLHGIGEVGSDINFPLLSSEVVSLTDEPIQSHFSSSGTGSQKGAYILVPQSPTPWGYGQAGALKSLIDSYLTSHPDIDPSRIYLAGASNGGGMVVTMGIAYPDYFAALVPIAASYPYNYDYNASEDLFTYTVTDHTYEALKNVPMWLIHSRADSSIPVDDSVLPFYKAMIDRSADNKWLSYYETATGTDFPELVYNGHWSWIYFFNDQVTGVQSQENTKNYKALWGMVATDPTQGGASKATVNGIEYDNIFDWLNAQIRP